MVRTVIWTGILIVVAMIMGCNGVSPPPNEYDVRLDPSLTAPQSERVLAALDEWGQKTGVIYRTNFSEERCAIPLVAGPRGCVHVQFTDDASAQRICVGPPGQHELGCAVGDYGHANEVYLTELDSGTDAYALALHELGHAFGLAHDTGNSVMRVPADFAAHYVTERDVAQFNRVRGDQ